MDQKIVVPHSWQVPDSIRRSIAEVPGSQRALTAEGHLLLILHKLPTAKSIQRELRMFWRAPDGTWESNAQGNRGNALQRHVTEYNTRLLELDERENNATSADDYFHIRSEVAPIHRAAQNMYSAISRGYETCPDDHALLVCRNLAASVERTSELLKDDATYGIEYAMAKQAELQLLASHRLNLIACVFFPILAIAAIFGMNLDHGLEHQGNWLFWILVAIGIAVGMVMKSVVMQSNTAKGQRKR